MKITKKIRKGEKMKNKEIKKLWNQPQSEIVGQGHPDPFADMIGDIINQESVYSATEVLINKKRCYITGETKLKKGNKAKRRIKKLLKELSKLYGAKKVKLKMDFVKQDDHLASRRGEKIIGDQEIVFFHKLNEFDVHFYLKKIRNAVDKKISFLDYKILVDMDVMKANLSISKTHKGYEEARKIIERLIKRYFGIKNINVCAFNGGSIFNDTGVTGRKIIVEREGCGYPHGGGAIFGKDSTKSAPALMAEAKKFSSKNGDCDVVGVYFPGDKPNKPTNLKKI